MMADGDDQETYSMCLRAVNVGFGSEEGIAHLYDVETRANPHLIGPVRIVNHVSNLFGKIIHRCLQRRRLKADLDTVAVPRIS